MPGNRPYCLSIAGFDPSGGAGILADIKTFESHKVYGLGACSAITFQDERTFRDLVWLDLATITGQLELLFRNYPVNSVKIGLIRNLEVLHHLVDFILLKMGNVKIIWDPIMKSGSGFEFHSALETGEVENICRKIFLITPNIEEACLLTGDSSAEEAARQLIRYCPVLLKGGHAGGDQSNDVLYCQDKKVTFESERIRHLDKHGTGCVLSASILAHLARGKKLEDACYEAKGYINRFLKSNEGLLGYHV